jgi:hypothetical protein
MRLLWSAADPAPRRTVLFHRRPHLSRSTPQTSSELWGMGGLQHASTEATHGESPKSFRLLSRGPVRLGQRWTCYYLSSYKMQQSMLLALLVRFSVTKRRAVLRVTHFNARTGEVRQRAHTRPRTHTHAAPPAPMRARVRVSRTF